MNSSIELNFFSEYKYMYSVHCTSPKQLSCNMTRIFPEGYKVCLNTHMNWIILLYHLY